MVPKYRFPSNFNSRLMGLLETEVEKEETSIVGAFSTVSLEIMGGAQNKVSIQREFAA